MEYREIIKVGLKEVQRPSTILWSNRVIPMVDQDMLLTTLFL
jgi:hypothetical protein